MVVRFPESTIRALVVVVIVEVASFIVVALTVMVCHCCDCCFYCYYQLLLPTSTRNLPISLVPPALNRSLFPAAFSRSLYPLYLQIILTELYLWEQAHLPGRSSGLPYCWIGEEPRDGRFTAGK